MLRHRLLAIALGASISAVALSQQNPQQNPVWAKPIYLLAAQKATGPLYPWPGGQGLCAVWGTWNGATVTFQNLTADGAALLTMGVSCTMTANGEGVFNLPAGLVQATISGAGASTSLSATIQTIPYPTIPLAR